MAVSYRSYLDFAVETAYLAGRLTLGYFQTGIRPDMKADDTPVTAADRASEQFIRGRIEKQYPQHTIVGEEYGVTEHAGAEFRWFVDPIDGTKSFVRGVPLYAVLIGLEVAGVIEVGAAVFPGTGRDGRGGFGRRVLVERPPRGRVGGDRSAAGDRLVQRCRQLCRLRAGGGLGAHPGRDLLPRRLG